MGLFDRFRRDVENPAPTKEDWLRIGRLEAQVESLRLQWESYRDEIHKLVQRLEKRDQRAQQREEKAAEQPGPALASDHELLKKARERRGLLR